MDSNIYILWPRDRRAHLELVELVKIDIVLTKTPLVGDSA